MLKLLLIAGSGSFIGGALRFLLNRFIPLTDVTAFPWATFCANTAGCFLIGLVYGLCAQHFNISPELKLFLTVGFCGGLTTFSTFINENLLLLNSRQFAMFIIYAAASFVAGLALVWVGNASAAIFKTA